MKNLESIFNQRRLVNAEPLFILEMANNHMGNVEHGLEIIRQIHAVTKDFPQWHFAFKFQYRDIPTFIHPDYKDRMDLKYVKRFSETALKEEEFLRLKKETEDLGFITMCTPFDEASVDKVVEHGYQILKIASASSTDWPLLDKIARTNLPIIASTGGTKLEDVDKLVSFLAHRKKTFAIEHCVGEYPTSPDHLQLNQIDLFKNRYPEVAIGFSTHEHPNNTEAIKLAVAKGAGIFEKHVAIKSDKYEVNGYSSTPEELRAWLNAAKEAYAMCGVAGQRAPFLEKELADIRQFQRGVFAVRDIEAGERVDEKNTFFAFPNQPGQLLANQLSKYTILTAREKIAKNAPVINIDKFETREKVWAIVQQARKILADANIPVSNQLEFEISHHYGIDRFAEFGATIITVVNREYAKKLIVMLPGQKHPTHAHKIKEETFHVLHGEFIFHLNKQAKHAKAGEVIVVERGVDHGFESPTGGVFEEVSTTHKGSGDSYYEDEAVNNNKNRKTSLTYWVD